MVIILNGSINSGKSTVAKILSKKLPNTAHVEVDKLREFIDWLDGDKAFPLSIENAVLVTKNFVEKGYNVIFSYVLSQKNYDFVIDNLQDINTKIYTFTLNPNINTALTNRGDRELSDKELKRIKYHYSIGINNPGFGKIIDNTSQSSEETANEILNYINNN